MQAIAVTTARVVKKQELAKLLTQELREMHKAAWKPADHPALASELLGLDPAELFDVQSDGAAQNGMGMVLTGSALVIAVKAIAASKLASKAVDAVVTTVVREMLLEALRRMRGKRGADFVVEASARKS